MRNKILVRGGASPFEKYDAFNILTSNLIGSNVGNLIYAYSIFRALYVDENTELISTKYRLSYKKKKLDQINSEYKAFVIPLADAFRESFVAEMDKTTKLVKQLEIPCVVAGVGIRAPYNYNKNMKFSFDENVKAFIDAVLEKSAIVGVRGEITASYLQNLGYIPEKHFTVIGCPSLFAYGNKLQVKDLNLSRESKIAFNNNIVATGAIQDFIINSTDMIPDHYFYPQRINELHMLYTGHHYIHQQNNPKYPDNIFHKLYVDDRVRFYYNADSWIDSMGEMDFSFGPRLHGNVASVLGGTPAVWIPHDARMKELIAYHNLPCIHGKDIKKDSNIFDYIEKIDVHSLQKGHEARFRHYVDFLNENGLDNIFENYDSPENTCFDLRLKGIERENLVKSVHDCDTEELLHRIEAITKKTGRKSELYKDYSDSKDVIDDLSTELAGVKDELRENKRTFKYRVLRKMRGIKKKIRG